MATKAEERKALEEIRRIVASLGNDSYLAMAFDGCFEMAESNIENDFANNPKMSIEKLKKDLRAANAKIKNADEAYEIVLKREQAEKKELDLAKATLKAEADRATKGWNSFLEMKDKVKALELENMKLKAKLYDLMVKED